MNTENAIRLVEIAKRVAQEETSWADWHNAVFGIDGHFGKLFQRREDRAAFVDSSYYSEIESVSRSLKEGKSIQEYTIPSGKFVVRIPKSLHGALASEAKAEGVSLNQLVLTKLSISLRSATKKLISANKPQPSFN